MRSTGLSGKPSSRLSERNFEQARTCPGQSRLEIIMRFAAHRLIDYWMPIDHLGRMDTTKLLLESIATRKCEETVYNRMAVKLAPHILYTRHDELFIAKVTIKREGKPTREIKIGPIQMTDISPLARTKN